MKEDRTRIFKATYTSKDNKVYHLNVRVFKRLASFGLAIALVKGGLTITGNLLTSGVDDINEQIEEVEKSEDLLLIETIIKENPNILKDPKNVIYLVKEDDTLDSIAEVCGTTVDKLRELNKLFEVDNVISGTSIVVEMFEDKEPKDRLISSLESYFYDYVFNSPVAKEAKSSQFSLKRQVNYYKSVIYGHPKSEADVDPDSLFGMYVNSYLNFHKEESEKSDTDKDKYIAFLTELAQKTVTDLNFDGMASTIIPFEQYDIYLQNKTTDFQSLQTEQNRIN